MEVTLFGITVDEKPITKVFVAVSIIALQLSRESYLVFSLATVIEVKPEQPEKASLPMEVTLLPMVTEVKPEQSEYL